MTLDQIREANDIRKKLHALIDRIDDLREEFEVPTPDMSDDLYIPHEHLSIYTALEDAQGDMNTASVTLETLLEDQLSI